MDGRAMKTNSPLCCTPEASTINSVCRLKCRNCKLCICVREFCPKYQTERDSTLWIKKFVISTIWAPLVIIHAAVQPRSSIWILRGFMFLQVWLIKPWSISPNLHSGKIRYSPLMKQLQRTDERDRVKR